MCEFVRGMPQVLSELINYTAGSSLFSCNLAGILHKKVLMFVCRKNAANSYKCLFALQGRLCFNSTKGEEHVICDNFFRNT